MPLTVTVPGVTVPVPATSVMSPTEQIVVTDNQMIGALQAGGYTVTPPNNPPPPPPPTGKPLWGVFHGNNQASPVPPVIELDYAYNSATAFSTQAVQAYTSAAKTLMLKVGVLNDSQAAAIANQLIAGGQPNAWVPHMWENNQGIGGWESAWNELHFAAAAFITQFLRQVAVMDAQPGAKFRHVWCPNLNQQGNQASGRNQLDTIPGPGPKNNISVGPDGYDNPNNTSDAGNIVAQLAPFEQVATAKGMKFAGLCETGVNGGDDATFWTHLLNHAATNGWAFVINFAATPSQGAAFNSDNGPNANAAIKAFYAS